MSTSQTRSQAVRQLLQLQVIPSSYSSSKVLITPRTPSSSSSTTMNTDSEDYYQSPAGNSETILFSVLCMHDFDGEDAGLLSFKMNEILDVVKRDDTGWWAAMRQEGPVVGWIPQAYVSPLTEEMAEKLRNTWEEVRIYEYEAEQLYNSVPINHNLALFDDPESAASSPRPEYEDYKVRWVTIYLQLTDHYIFLGQPKYFSIPKSQRYTTKRPKTRPEHQSLQYTTFLSMASTSSPVPHFSDATTSNAFSVATEPCIINLRSGCRSRSNPSRLFVKSEPSSKTTNVG